MGTRFTKHAMRRMRQRGVRNVDINWVVNYASRWVNVGGGLVSLTLTKSDQQLLRSEAPDRQMVDRLAQTAVLIDPSDGSVISVIKGRAARYRRRYH